MHRIVTHNSLYIQLSKKMDQYGTHLLRIALAIIFIWFGGLKVLGMSPAQELVEKTIYWFRPDVFVPILGLGEVLIGVGLLIKRAIPFTLILLLFHMAGTFLPFFILPEICFDAFPYCPSMEGQYILKNLVLITGALVVGGKYNVELIAQDLG